MDASQEILDFWLKECEPKDWYRVDPKLDDTIREKFGELWETAASGKLSGWIGRPSSALALIILLDQFPRNMFRGDARSFATDSLALKLAKSAILREHDKKFDYPEKQFFYLPYMHAEISSEQDRGVRLFLQNGDAADNLEHARAHRWVIRKFGRFPYRNEALGRSTTKPEQEFLDAGGYAEALRQVRSAG
ncbi:DUF924 family protein [Amaricoccus tamworthensis]|uniref:DUF924 family protein n=1 Tax=Amaricoccus tamworthensis TaxID=57002 RepID=UPI003C7DE565